MLIEERKRARTRLAAGTAFRRQPTTSTVWLGQVTKDSVVRYLTPAKEELTWKYQVIVRPSK